MTRSSKHSVIANKGQTFNKYYIGKYGNSFANRKSLVSNLNGTYFKTLMRQGYLSNDEVSYCELDVDATKIYLESLGTDTDDMKDIDILRHRIDTHVFIKCRLLVMDVIEVKQLLTKIKNIIFNIKDWLMMPHLFSNEWVFRV